MASSDLVGLLEALRPFVDPSSKYKRLALTKKNLEESVEDVLNLYYFTIFTKYRKSVLSSPTAVNLPNTCNTIKDKLFEMQKDWDTLDLILNCVEDCLPFLPVGAQIFGRSSYSQHKLNILVNVEKILADCGKLIELDWLLDEIDKKEAELKECGEAVIKQLERVEGTQNIVHAWKITCDKQYLDDFLQKTKHTFETTIVKQGTPEANEFKLHDEVAKGIHEQLCRGEKIEKIVSAYENADPIKGVRVKLTKKFVGELRDLNLEKKSVLLL